MNENFLIIEKETKEEFEQIANVLFNKFAIVNHQSTFRIVEIETGKIYAGDLPTRQLKKAFDWIAGNKDLASSIFNELNPHL